MKKLGAYSKTIAAVVAGVLGWFAVVIAADASHFHVTPSQWLELVAVLATALGVYGVPNTTPPKQPQAP